MRGCSIDRRRFQFIWQIARGEKLRKPQGHLKLIADGRNPLAFHRQPQQTRRGPDERLVLLVVQGPLRYDLLRTRVWSSGSKPQEPARALPEACDPWHRR
jgi:hypothetical protein